MPSSTGFPTKEWYWSPTKDWCWSPFKVWRDSGHFHRPTQRTLLSPFHILTGDDFHFLYVPSHSHFHFLTIITVYSLGAWVTTLPTPAENLPTRLFNLPLFSSPGSQHKPLFETNYCQPWMKDLNILKIFIIIFCSLAFTITWQFAQFVLLIQVWIEWWKFTKLWKT